MDNNNNNIDPNTFRIATWNMGSDKDWTGMNDKVLRAENQVTGTDGKVLSPLGREKAEADRINGEVEKYREGKIQGVFEAVKADIIFIQEAIQSNRGNSIDIGYMRELLPSGYHLQTGDGADTVIAFNAKLFDVSEGLSVMAPPVDEGGNRTARYTVVDLKHRATGQIIRVVSAHLKGTMFKDKVHVDELGYDDSADGTKQLKDLMQRVEKQSKGVSLILWGFDANVTPKHPRLDVLHDKGYTLDGEHKETAFDLYLADEYHKELKGAEGEKREPKLFPVTHKLDYLAMRTPKGSAVKATWTFPEELETEIITPVGRPDINPSDHGMVIRDVKITEKSTFKKLFG